MDCRGRNRGEVRARDGPLPAGDQRGESAAMTDGGPSIADKVKDWFEKQGYPLEFEVARKLRARTLRAVQGQYYEDLETRKPRELDVLAWQERKGRHPFARIVVS